MDENAEKFAQLRLEVSVNGKRRAMLGAAPAESVFVGVGHSKSEVLDGTRTELFMFAKFESQKQFNWTRGTVLYGPGDEVLIKVIGPGNYDAAPTKFFPLPPQVSGHGSDRLAEREQSANKHDNSVPIRLEASLNGQRLAMLGVESGGLVHVGVTHARKTDETEPQTDMAILGVRFPSKAAWTTEPVSFHLSDELLIRVVGAGEYELPSNSSPVQLPPYFSGNFEF